MPDEKFLWVITNYGYPSLPTIKRYVMVKKTPAGWYTVLVRGSVTQKRTAQGYTFCETEEEATKKYLALLEGRLKSAESLVKRFKEAVAEGMAAVEVVPHEFKDYGPVKLDD